MRSVSKAFIRKKGNFINDSSRQLVSFCISLPNELWELCAVVITTRCQLGNLYANGIGLGLISLPIRQDPVSMGMPISSSSNFNFFGEKARLRHCRKETEVWGRNLWVCNLIGQVEQELWNWCEEKNLSCAAWIECQRTGTQRRGSGGQRREVVRQDLDRIAWQPCTGTPPLSPSAEPWMPTFQRRLKFPAESCPFPSRAQENKPVNWPTFQLWLKTMYHRVEFWLWV